MNGYLLKQQYPKLVKRKNFIWSLCCCAIMLVAMTAWRPADFLQDLQQRYDASKSKYTPVKIHLVFNQPQFAPGDTAFFQAWYTNEELVGVKGEHSVTVDLFNGRGSTAQRIRFKVKNGQGYSQVVFRKDLPPGEYTIVAYTDWMKNFGDSWYFKKRIQIVSGKQIKVARKQDDPIRFYPEGGNFIGGVSNKVAVLGPPDVELIIKDKHESQIATVSLDSAGLGSFIMTPELDGLYFTTSPAGGKQMQLPAVVKDGITVRMVQNDVAELQFSLPPNSSFVDKALYAIVMSRGKILVRHEIVVHNSQPFQLQIPSNDHGDALHQVYVFDVQGKILTQRVFVPYPKKNVVATFLLPAATKQREQVSGTLELLDAAGNPVAADLSITVYQQQLFTDYFPTTDFYLYDLPEAADWVEKFGIYNTSLNDFLITQKWKRIDWDIVLTDKPIKILFPFYSETKLRGQVLSKKTGSAAPDSTIIISYLQKNTVGYEAYIKDGKFEMPLVYDVWGDDYVFATLKNKSKSVDDSYSITISQDSVKSAERWVSTESAETSAYGEFAVNKNLVVNSYSFFAGKQDIDSRHKEGPNSVFEDEFRGADYEVDVEDYLTFPTMVDLLQEAVPFARYRKRGTEESIRMAYRYETTLKVFKDDPLYIIDGVMSKNTAFFLSLKPEELRFIKILNNPNKLTQLGRLGENAVIFVESKKGDLFESIAGENLFPVVGLNRPKDFFDLKYSPATVHARIPDVRSTLYWKPSVETNKSGVVDINFFASDDIGPMKILVRGVTKDGKPISFEQVLNVGYNPVK